MGFTHPPIHCVPWIRTWPELEHPAPSISNAKCAYFYFDFPDILNARFLILQNK